MRLQKPERNIRLFSWTQILLVFLLSLFPFLDNVALGQALRPVDPSHFPAFHDDLDRQSLLQAANRQATYLQGLPPKNALILAGHAYSPQQLLDSIKYFIQIVEQTNTSQDIGKILQKTFKVYQATGKNKGPVFGQMLVTGYYEPIFEGSLRRENPFLYPLYTQPADLICRKRSLVDKTGTGRFKDSAPLPYWTRAEIETRNILAGNELVFLKDPFEAFLLHVQGSGKIHLRDGSLRAVCYAASNGQPYRSIGKLLVDEKKMSLAEATLPAIEGYLRKHPGDMMRILHSNPRFIFFRWGDNAGPRGSNNILLTVGRSIAIDQHVLPPGTIGFLISRRPEFDKEGRLVKWLPLQRFVFPQDSGAAIQGAGRVDLFLGDSNEAMLSAGLMKEEGTLYFLLKK